MLQLGRVLLIVFIVRRVVGHLVSSGRITARLAAQTGADLGVGEHDGRRARPVLRLIVVPAGCRCARGAPTQLVTPGSPRPASVHDRTRALRNGNTESCAATRREDATGIGALAIRSLR